MAQELTLLKPQTAADDDTTEALATLVKQAKHFRQLPAAARTLLNADIRNLYTRHCGTLRFRRQPYRNCYRDFRTITHIACRALVSAAQTFLTAREPLNEETFPFLTKLLVPTTTTQHTPPRTVHELHTRLNDAETLPTAPFGHHDPDEQLFNAHAWYSMTMLAALELPDVPFHVLLTTHLTSTALQDDIMQHRSAFAEAVSQQRRIYPTVAEVCEVLQQFYNDSYAQHLKQDWLLKALKIPEARRHDVDYIAELLSTATEDFFLHAQQHGITATPFTKHTLATCSLFRLLLTVHKPPKVVILRFGPTLRLLANLRSQCCKQYTPQEKCGADVELAANTLPAYFGRLADSGAQSVLSSSSAGHPAAVTPDLMLPVATPPVMCWICGEGFTHNGAFLKHCSDAHGDYAEYRKRLLWRAQQDGFKPLLPWVKRHILQSATFHLTFSVPGSFSLHWNHPEAVEIAKTRCEVACVVCARKDWLEKRFSVYLWREATDKRTCSELRHTNSGAASLLTCGDTPCFGNRALINEHLSTDGYMDRRPLIPKAELFASSVLHPADHSMAWLLHTRRTPLLPDSRRARSNISEQSVCQDEAQGNAGQLVVSNVGSTLGEPTCAGVGDPDQTAHICFDCAGCLCVDDKFIKMPEYALANDLWLGRERTALQNGTLGLRMLLGLGRPCFRKLLLGKGQKDTLQSGFTGNHILISQASATLAEALPPPSTHLKDSFVVIFGQSADDLRRCQLLTVKREVYKALALERARVNAIFAEVPLDLAAVSALPLNGVPQQLLDCAIQMPEVDQYKATRPGPGTVRDPLDAACPSDDASDELSDCDHDEHTANAADGAAAACAAQPSTESQDASWLAS